MTYKLKISKQNQVTIPVDLLKQLGLTGGNYLYIKPDEEDFRIINTRAKINKLAGSLGHKIKDKSKLLLSDEEFEEALEKSKIEYFKNWKV
jgi:bifunctional DNA-binding transcriptional regulator/antitoxin component of YhaV-PrlF toxin-antitoxin module